MSDPQGLSEVKLCCKDISGGRKISTSRYVVLTFFVGTGLRIVVRLWFGCSVALVQAGVCAHAANGMGCAGAGRVDVMAFLSLVSCDCECVSCVQVATWQQLMGFAVAWQTQHLNSLNL